MYLIVATDGKLKVEVSQQISNIEKQKFYKLDIIFLEIYFLQLISDKSGNLDIEFESIEDEIHENNEIGRYFKIKK